MDVAIWILATLGAGVVANQLGALTGMLYRRWRLARRRRALIARLEAKMRGDADRLQGLLQAVRDK